MSAELANVRAAFFCKEVVKNGCIFGEVREKALLYGSRAIHSIVDARFRPGLAAERKLRRYLRLFRDRLMQLSYSAIRCSSNNDQ